MITKGAIDENFMSFEKLEFSDQKASLNATQQSPKNTYLGLSVLDKTGDTFLSIPPAKCS